MNLNELRRKIDLIDNKILQLLIERLTCAAQTIKFKSTVADSTREQEIVERLSQMSSPILPPQMIPELYTLLFKYSRELQSQALPLVAFQGEHGAFSESAAQFLIENCIPVPCRTFGEIAEGLQEGTFDYGVVPVENKLTGTVSETNELLITNNLKIVAALEMSIKHCLLGLPGSSIDQIRKVYSHPQALAQCRKAIRKFGIEPVPYYDTAGAAKMVSEEGLESIAAIASPLAAKLYNLQILSDQIADLPHNTTRFLLLGLESNSSGNKGTIMFATEHKAGTLYKVLGIFAQLGINLTRIESAPLPPERYVFFLDFIGAPENPNVTKALDEVKKVTTDFKLLGFYNERVVL